MRIQSPGDCQILDEIGVLSEKNMFFPAEHVLLPFHPDT
jgi:hypothetical protein